MRNRKRRFNSALEVRLEIASLMAKSNKELSRAASLEGDILKANLNQEISQEYKTRMVDELRMKSNKLQRHVCFLRDRKIPMLVRVLAKLNTKPMPFMGDTSEMEEVIE